MKINACAPIFSLKGKPISHADGEAATFRSIVVEALLSRRPEDKDAAACYKLFALASRLVSQDIVTLTVEEATMIKARVASNADYTNLVIGRICEQIEQATETK